MKQILLFTALLFALNILGQDTFSIVAVDTITGEIGSAGASCIDASQIEGGALIISDVLPGRGAIHTQSYWNSTNQQNAHDRMVEGMSPAEIIQWLSTHDAQNNPSVRQYGIVDFDSNGHARSAGYTGANCMNYKNHIAGINYCIQGNILLGQQILDSIEAGFLNTEGSFAEKMMAALQGANVVGADTRCTNNGTSSLSAFIRVARPEDPIGGFYCDLNVPELPEGMEPIDSLQTLFDAWLETVVGVGENEMAGGFTIYPNPAGDVVTVAGRPSAVSSRQSAVSSRRSPVTGQQSAVSSRQGEYFQISICNIEGRTIKEVKLDTGFSDQVQIHVDDILPGIYFLSIYSGNTMILSEKLIIIR